MSDSDQQDWRLEAELGADGARHGRLERLVGHVHDSGALAGQVAGSVSHDIVITHDGNCLFAYAPSRAALDAARGAVEGALRNESDTATITLSHWDDDLARWEQVEPPPDLTTQSALEAEHRTAEEPATQTFVSAAGNNSRDVFEQAMLDCAAQLGLECRVEQHRHLLQSQVAFTVSGPRGKIDQFRDGLDAEARASTRALFYEYNPL